MTTDMGDFVATESRPAQEPECRFCGAPLPPQKVRRGRPKEFCGDRCRRQQWEREHPRQLAILFLPDSKRRSTKSRNILARLAQGPATTWDLMRIGGSGWRSRLQELREGQVDGTAHQIRTESHGDYAVYTLEGE